MAVDNEAVKQIAYLARLGVEEDKLEETQREFNKILAWVEELGEVDTNGVEPMFSPHEENILLRNDEVVETEDDYGQEKLDFAEVLPYNDSYENPDPHFYPSQSHLQGNHNYPSLLPGNPSTEDPQIHICRHTVQTDTWHRHRWQTEAHRYTDLQVHAILQAAHPSRYPM